ncbi:MULTISPECIES: hypothetical protein [Gordonia]|uniref:hypothetical protein n=1 Tax=Gordonia TaxID=2053 RepID=UPI00133174AB|nr:MULTISPECIES: hypothetical protein [Gordonia]KAF0971390.1 hypothetical protein BPODLACK_00576 [Gordonia sp. YY1]MCR8898273.1 hypothetical protein [Gordonia sp. GONU]MCZ0915267.1 hypothetical protein [Gordonia amicalis]UPW16264.1 hypothetical protein M0655_13445 [Gordonia amicalis]
MNTVMLILVLATGVIASACAIMAAFIYLRRGRDPLTADRGARRWLVATAIFGISAIVLRFVWLLML